MNPREMKELRLGGLALSAGVALGGVCRLNESRHSDLPIYRVDESRIDQELQRFERAVQVVSEQLDALRENVRQRIGAAEAEIFTVQRLILRDDDLYRQIEKGLLERGVNVEAMVAEVLDAYETRLREVASETLQDRASDIGEVKRRLLDTLRGTRPAYRCADDTPCRRGRDRIVVARELSPALTVELDATHTLGFITESGGRNAHAAILARALGIPAVSKIGGVDGQMPCGTPVLVDGNGGVVYVRPSEATLARYRDALGTREVSVEVHEPVPAMRVLANVNRLQELDEVERMQAEGIGLYRTEFEFMMAGRLLDEEEQYKLYATTLERMQGRPVTFRLLDAGADKVLPTLSMPEENNPAMGLRGARFLLQHPELLATQAAALLRAAEHGPVHVLYPMISGVEQFRALRSLFMETARNFAAVPAVKHGVMFEIPAAVLDAEALLEEAEFASIGTNDLLQYLLAIDRDNAGVAEDYRTDHPAFIKMMKHLADVCARAGKRVTVCGEMAGDPEQAVRLAEMGYREISVAPRQIPAVRRALREV